MGERGFVLPVGKLAFLIERKFGPTIRNRFMITRRITGSGNASDEPDLSNVVAYEAELCALSRERLQALFEEEQAKESAEQQAKAEHEEAHRFFNGPRAEADYQHWSKAAYWRLDEAIALSFGKEPKVVSWKRVKEYVGRSRFATQYERRRDLVQRAARKQQLSDPVLPGFFLAWAKRHGIDYPAELETQVEARGHQITDWKSRYDELHAQFNNLKAQQEAHTAEVQVLLEERDGLRVRVAELEQTSKPAQAEEKPLLTKERETVLKLIITMAIKGYAYNSQKKRSDTTRDIANDLDSLGLSLDADTVRKWLREAAELLPPDKVENRGR
jgi:hypothetical protein